MLLYCNIYIRPVSSVQNKLRFILHEPYDLSWPLTGRSLGKKHVLLRFVDLRFMDLPRHQSRSYRMNANRSSFNS